MAPLWAAPIIAGTLLGGCGSTATAPDPGDAPIGLSELPLTVVDAPVGAERRLRSPRPATLGLTAEGVPLVSTGTTVSALENSGTRAFTLYAGSGDPTTLGAVRAIAPRQAGGSWVGASSGLFYTEGDYVAWAGSAAAPLDLDEVASGPFAGLWMTTAAGLLHAVGTELWTYDGLDGTLDSFAATSSHALVLGSEGAYALTLTIEGLRAEPLEIADVFAVAVTPGAEWIASPSGVAVRFAGGDWRALSVDGAPLEAETLVGASDAAYLVTPAGELLALTPGASETLIAERLSTAVDGPLVADPQGGVWSLEGDTLVGRRLEGVASFARDVAPFLAQNCLGCHPTYDQLEVFKTRASAALSRLQSGDMPRCAGNQLCSPESLPAPSSYAALERWIQQGQLP